MAPCCLQIGRLRKRNACIAPESEWLCSGTGATGPPFRKKVKSKKVLCHGYHLRGCSYLHKMGLGQPEIALSFLKRSKEQKCFSLSHSSKVCRYQSSCQGIMLMKPRKELKKLNSSFLLYARPKYLTQKLKPSSSGSRENPIGHLQPQNHHSP